MIRYATLLVLLLGCSLLHAEEPQDHAKMRKEIQKQLELIQPGQEHADLKKLAGQWDVTMVMGSRDLDFNGSATASMILGDRFLVVDGSGKPSGRDSAFRYTIGFDRRHNEYVITLRDTAGTYPVHARGKAMKDSIRMVGKDNDPRMSAMGLTKKFAFQFDVRSDNEFAIETIYIDTRTSDEKDRPAFQYVFKRR